MYEARCVDMITTARARNPTNNTPMDVSSGSGECLRMSEIPATIAPAATIAPIEVSTPMMNAMAMPGSTPCASASPRKLIPRSTTHVPTSDVVTTVRRPASSASRISWESTNGAIHHPHGSLRNSTSVSLPRRVPRR